MFFYILLGSKIGGFQQAQRRAAGDRSGRKYSEKYVFMSKNMTFGSLGSLLPFSKAPQNSSKLFKNDILLLFSFVTWSLLAKNYFSMIKILTFDPLGPKVTKNRNFQKWYFFLFSFVTLSLPAKNYVSITKSVNFGPLGPFCPFKKGPRTHQKRKFSKITISSVLLCHIEPTYQT